MCFNQTGDISTLDGTCRELGEYSAGGGDQAGFSVVGGHVGDVIDVWPIQ